MYPLGAVAAGQRVSILVVLHLRVDAPALYNLGPSNMFWLADLLAAANDQRACCCLAKLAVKWLALRVATS